MASAAMSPSKRVSYLDAGQPGLVPVTVWLPRPLASLLDLASAYSNVRGSARRRWISEFISNELNSFFCDVVGSRAGELVAAIRGGRRFAWARGKDGEVELREVTQ